MRKCDYALFSLPIPSLWNSTNEKLKWEFDSQPPDKEFPSVYIARISITVIHKIPPTDPILHYFNLLKPTGYVMHHQFSIQQLYALPTLYLCVLYLSENKQRLVPLQHKLIGFYNRDEKCLQRGTDWVFKWSLLVTWCTNRFNIQQLYALPTLYLCVLYLSENKQRLVPLTA